MRRAFLRACSSIARRDVLPTLEAAGPPCGLVAKFQIDPAGPPVPRAPPPAPAPAASAAPPPPPPPRARPAPGKGRTVLLVAAAAALLLGGTAVGAMYALDLGPFAYPERYLLTQEEVPAGMRLQALPAPIRQELGIEENPDRVPDEKLDEFSLNDRPDVEPEEAWVESVGTGRLGEQVLIVAARYASEDDARTAVGSASNDCNSRDGSGVAMRDGKVVVILLAFTDGAAARLPAVEAALRDKADGLAVACRW